MNNNEMEFEYLNDSTQQKEKKDHSKIISVFLSIAMIAGYILYGFICVFCFIIEAVATIFLLSSFKSKGKRKKRWF